jgi:hypothetical protein
VGGVVGFKKRRHNLVGCCFRKRVMSNPMDSSIERHFCVCTVWSSSCSRESLRLVAPRISVEAGSILGTLWIEGKFWFSPYSSSFYIDNEILVVLVGWSAVCAEICSPGARKQELLGDSSRNDPVGGCALVMLRPNGGCRQDC